MKRQRQQKHRIPLKKKIFFILVANAILAILLFVVGECFLRLRAGWISGPADWLVADPDLGYKLNPLNEHVNSLGIRHGEISTDTADDHARLLILGDSVSWEEDGFVTMLRVHFDEWDAGNVEVINAAIPGYTTFQERMLLERDLLELQPDLVILQYCLNDNHRFLHELDDQGRWLFTQEARNAMLPGGDGWFQNLLRSSYLITEIRIRILAITSHPETPFPWMDQSDFATAWHEASWDDTREHLMAIRDLLKQIESQFVIVAVPYGPQLRQDLLELDSAFTTRPQRMLEDITRELQIPFLDLHPVFVANRDKRLFTDGIHLTDEGHKLVESELMQFLIMEQLAPVTNSKQQL